MDRAAQVLVAVAADGGLPFLACRLWQEYARRRKSHLSLKKREEDEEDELLKCDDDAVFSDHRVREASHRPVASRRRSPVHD